MTQAEAHEITSIILKRYADAGYESWAISPEVLVKDAIEEWEKRK